MLKTSASISAPGVAGALAEHTKHPPNGVLGPGKYMLDAPRCSATGRAGEAASQPPMAGRCGRCCASRPRPNVRKDQFYELAPELRPEYAGLTDEQLWETEQDRC